MDSDAMLALAALALAASWTPGPNNALLAASGARFGLRATLPHMAGVTLGFSAMILAVGLGLGAVFLRVPLAGEVLRWVGAAVLLWFAWRIATAGEAGSSTARARPFSFLEAAGFQWVNPKGWAMCIGTASQFGAGAGGTPAGTAALIAAVFLVTGITSSLGWTAFGAAMQRVLSTPARRRAFNIVMGLLVASFVVVLFRD